MDSRQSALIFIAAGATAIVVGLLLFSGALGWVGRLPGDIRIEGEHTRLYIPITTMILVSLALSLTAFIIRRWL